MAAFIFALLTAFIAQASPAPAPKASPAPAPQASPAPAPEPLEGTPAPSEGSPAPSAAMPPPPGVQFQPPLENGACLDSIRAVPTCSKDRLRRGMQIVRIDQVVSTATMLPGEVIGFLYTTQDGSTWLGQRTKDYQSAADATAINRVLAAAHMPATTSASSHRQACTGFRPSVHNSFACRCRPRIATLRMPWFPA